MTLSPEDLRTLGEAIGRGMVKEATQNLRYHNNPIVPLVQQVLGIDGDRPGVTVRGWIADAVRMVRNG